MHRLASVLALPALPALACAALACAALACAAPLRAQHPCVPAGDTARPVAPAPGQPSTVAVVTTASDAAMGRTRAWIADTVDNRCLGYVETAVGAPVRWIGFAPRPSFTRVALASGGDGSVAGRDAAVRAFLALPPWSATSGELAAALSSPAAATAAAATAAAATAAAASAAGSARSARAPNDPVGRRFLADFRKYADQWWAKEGDSWLGNYYDRAWIYYQASDQPGTPESLRALYRSRAAAIVVDYRTKYLERNNYGANPHNSQLRGVAEHFRRTGDTLSRQAVIRTADVLARAFMPTGYMSGAAGESRIAGRVLEAQLLAWELADSGAKRALARRVDSALARIAAWQAPDGSYPARVVCGGQLNYMQGVLNDALIATYERYRQDPKILDLVRRSADYLWRTQWVPGRRAFQYASVDCPRNDQGLSVGGPRPAADLNLMFVTTYGWLHRVTGDATYRDRAEQIFASGVEHAYLAGTKQFNEAYASSFRYLDYR